MNKLLKLSITQFLVVVCIVIALTSAALSAQHLTNQHHKEAKESGYDYVLNATKLVELKDYNNDLYYMCYENIIGEQHFLLVHKTTHQHYNVRRGLPVTMFYQPTYETMRVDEQDVDIVKAYGMIGNFFFIETIWLIGLCIVMPASTIVFIATLAVNTIGQKRRAKRAKEKEICAKSSQSV